MCIHDLYAAYANKDPTISHHDIKVSDPAALAFSALGWVMADDLRASRFLSLTGLTPDELRAGLMDRGVQCAVLDFLSAHEPDLVAAAEALAVSAQALIAARDALDGRGGEW